MTPDGNWLPAWLNTRKVRRFAGVCHGDLLDVGCGTRPYEPILGPRVRTYVGFDHPGTQHDRSRVDVWGDAAALPFEDGSFDTVVSFHVLEHTEDPGKVVSEMARVLRPGGIVLLAVPFMWGLHELPRDFFRLTPAGLVQLLERAGLERAYVEPICGSLGTQGLLASYFLLRLVNQAPALKPVAAPAVAGVQLAAIAADHLYRDVTDAGGYIAVATRPG